MLIFFIDISSIILVKLADTSFVFLSSRPIRLV
jgi:hypothetical protein